MINDECNDDPVTNNIPQPATIIGLLSTLILGSSIKIRAKI